MKLTEHFSLEEMTASETAAMLNIVNEPNVMQRQNLVILCRLILENLRAKWGKPLVINSGFRSQELNAAVGGASTSYHLQGRAADIHCEDYKMASQLATLAKNLPGLDLAIIETKGGANWLHVQYSPKPRHKIIEIIKP